MRQTRHILLGSVLVATVLGASGAAFADNAARAQVLFDEAKRLMDAKKFVEACPKLAESLDIDAALGTRLYLGFCYEKAGKSASAFAQYTEAVRVGGNDKRLVQAKQHLTALGPSLAMLTLMGDLDEGASVKLDDKLIDGFEVNKEFPVDPGHHSLLISAPGKIARTLSVEMEANTPASLGLPVLEDDESLVQEKKPTPPRSAPTTPVEAPPSTHALSGATGTDAGGRHATEGSGSGQRVVGWLTVGVGVVALNVGATFGVLTLANASDVKTLCPTGPCTTQQGIDKNDAAHSSALLADILVPAGLAVIGLGALLVATSSPSHPATARVRFQPTVGTSSGGLNIAGAF